MSMQAQVRAFVTAHGLRLDAALRYIDLTSEVGELGKALLHSGEYGQSPIMADEETLLEIGDCLFSLLALCDALDVDAQAALQAALAKYAGRWAQKGAISSDNLPKNGL